MEQNGNFFSNAQISNRVCSFLGVKSFHSKNKMLKANKNFFITFEWSENFCTNFLKTFPKNFRSKFYLSMANVT